MGQVITIKVLPQSQMRDISYLGEYIDDLDEIHICDAIDVKQRRAILSHELFHAFLAYSGYNQLLDTVHPDLEEAMTRAFERAIGGMVHYTPAIESWLDR